MTSINLNKVAQIYHFETDKLICVSRTTRENLSLRTNFPLDKFIVIPNAIDYTNFTYKKKTK
jgi:hypothetical protein